MAVTMIRAEPPDWCTPSKGDWKKASNARIPVSVASHFPFWIKGDKNMARAERNARVAIVSAMALPHATDPLALHKQEE